MKAFELQENDKMLQGQLIDLAFRKINFSVISALLLALLLVTALWPVIEHERLFSWLAAMAAIMAGHIVYLRRYVRMEGKNNPAPWARGFIIASAAAGLVWGSTVFCFPSTPFDPLTLFGVFVFPSTPFDPVTVLVLFVLAGMTAYAGVALASVPSAALAFLGCAWLPLAMWLFSFGERMYVVMGLIALGYMGAMVMLSRQMYNSIRNLISVEARMRQREEYQRTLLDNFPYFAWLKDRDSRLLAANLQYARVARVANTRELEGKTDFDFFPQDLAAKYVADDRTVMAGGEVKSVEEMYVDENGVRRWMETWKSPVAVDGKVVGTVGCSRDITGRKETELAREAALSEAVRLGQLRSAFLAQMSHELRTPLNGILGYAQNLLLDGNLSDKQRSSLIVIQHSGDHLLGLLNDVLDHAKIEADKLEINFGEVRMEELLIGVTELMRSRAEQKKLGFVCSLDGDLPSVIRGDGQRLRQVLLNLLSNAIKFTERGRVSLRVSSPAAKRLRFVVSDTGAGIAKDKLESIFIPFEQTEDGRRIGGTGLGLAISRKLARLMGGDIQVESRPGKGSVFSFEIDAEILNREALDSACIQAATEPAAIEPEIPFVPPRQELENLYEIAKRGNMRHIVQYADELAGRDVRYAAFAGQLGSFANSYQSKAILQFVEKYLEGRQENCL